MITQDNWAQSVRFITNEVVKYKGTLLLLGGKYLEGEMKQRIFNKGLSSTLIKIGKYKSKFWKKKREERGNQIGYVDLEFSGDLFNSIQVVEEGKESVVLAIISDLEYKKAIGQEIIQGKKIGINRLSIFYPSIDEETETELYISDLLFEKLENIIVKL